MEERKVQLCQIKFLNMYCLSRSITFTSSRSIKNELIVKVDECPDLFVENGILLT